MIFVSKIKQFTSMRIKLKMSAKWQPFCLCLNVARDTEENPEGSDMCVVNPIVINFFQSTGSWYKLHDLAINHQFRTDISISRMYCCSLQQLKNAVCVKRTLLCWSMITEPVWLPSACQYYGSLCIGPPMEFMFYLNTTYICTIHILHTSMHIILYSGPVCFNINKHL